MDSESSKAGKNKGALIGLLLLIFLIIGVVGFYLNSQEQDIDASGQFTPGPPPPGPAPPGKVWSYEHDIGMTPKAEQLGLGY